MSMYIVFINRKKHFDETLNNYYESITLGIVDAKDAPKALMLGATTFHREQITLDVIAMRRASSVQQQVLAKRQKAGPLSP